MDHVNYAKSWFNDNVVGRVQRIMDWTRNKKFEFRISDESTQPEKLYVSFLHSFIPSIRGGTLEQRFFQLKREDNEPVMENLLLNSTKAPDNLVDLIQVHPFLL